MEEEKEKFYCGKAKLKKNEDGCLPAPWDKELYPTVYQTSGDIWLVHAESYGIEMWTKGSTKEEAIGRWNRRA